MRVGDELQLTCVSSGGFPPPTLRWFRDATELESDAQYVNGISRASVTIVVEESDRAAEYHCQASNFATTDPIIVSTFLIFQKGTVGLHTSCE